MKKLIIFILLCLSGFTIQAQTKLLATFHATSGSRNGEDITQQIVNGKICTQFYTIDDELCMRNYSQATEEQIFGPIWNFISHTEPETSQIYQTDLFRFKWNTFNVYGQFQGTLSVELIKIYKPAGVSVRLRMVSDALDILEYMGYMEGSLNF